MLQNWLSPINQEVYNRCKELSRYQFGKRLLIHYQEFPDLTNVNIAIIGIGQNMDTIRNALYQMSSPFSGINIADLGDTRKEEISFIIPIIRELVENGVIPIIIGSSEDLGLAQYQAYQNHRMLINLALVDDRIRYNPSARKRIKTLLHGILDAPKSHLFNLSAIAYQAHYTLPTTIKNFNKRNFELVRLGLVKSAIEEIEPVVRDADLLCFNISALKQCEAPGQLNASPSGLFTEDACQISRYAGMNDKLTSIGFYGYDQILDQNNQGSESIAQMIWYFIDGVANRKRDYPYSTNSLVEYIVSSKKQDYQVTFWKSKKSGRWWMQIPFKTKKKHKRHKLVPCSYLDYQMACNNDFPDRLINAYKRFS